MNIEIIGLDAWLTGMHLSTHFTGEDFVTKTLRLLNFFLVGCKTDRKSLTPVEFCHRHA
jgi:hypothetical protein